MRTNYIKFFLVAFILSLTTSIGQTTLIDEDFRSGEQPAGWTSEGVIFVTVAGGYANFDAPDAELISPSFDASAFGELEINFSVAKFEGGDDGPITVEVSTDGGDNFSVVGVSPTPSSSTYIPASLTVTTLSDDMVLRFSRPDSPSKKRFRDLEVIASGTPGTPGGGSGQLVLTYEEGNIPVSGSTFNPDCSDAFLDVVVPEGSVISTVDVTYQISTQGGAWTVEQRSRLVISDGPGEPNFLECSAPGTTGSCASTAGVTTYSREGLSFAQGESGTVTFELQVFGTWPGGPYCDEVYHFVPNATWTLTVNYVDAPECGLVSGLTVVDQTDTTVDLAWSEVEEAETYNWSIFAQGDNPATDTPLFSGTTSDEVLTVSGLIPNTSYFALVLAECEGGALGLSSQPAPFTTDCGAQSGDFLENFNTTATGQIPDCWNGITNSTANPFFDVIAFGLPFNGPNQLRATSSGDIDTEHFFVSPELTDLSDGRRVTFYARQTTATAANMIEVGVMSDPEDEATFVSLEAFTFSGTNIQFYVVDLPDTLTENHFAFRFSYNVGTGTSNFQTVYLDEISYEATPPCDFIDGLVIDSFDQTTVSFSWDALDNAESYNWEVYEAGDTVGEDTPAADGNSPTNSASASGLDSNTSYFVVVSGDCGPDDGLGANSAPASFTTLCDAFSSPFGEDFEDAATGSLPDCWLQLDSAETSGAFNITTFGTPMQGSQQLQSSSGNNDAVQRFLISPQLTDLLNNDKRVTFLARTTSTVSNNATIALGIMSDPTDASTFLEVNSWTLTTTATQYQADIDFAFIEEHFAIRFTYGGTFVTTYIDDINYFDIPACDVPQEVSNDDLSLTSADFSWNAVVGAESYNWVVVEQGGDPTEEDDIVASGNTTNTEVFVDGLEEETNYQFFVKSDCDALGEGEFSLPLSFFTGYCIPSSTSTSDYITEFTTTDALTNVSIIKNAVSPNGYANLSDTEIITVFPGSSFDILNTFNFASHNVAIWIDWNDNLVFEQDEQVFQVVSSVNTVTGTIDIPSDVELGSYRMRLRARFGSSPLATPCGAQTWADAIDFTVLVVEEPDCLAPSDLVVDDVTTTTVNFSWEDAFGAESYVWEIYEAAAIIGEDTPTDSGVSVLSEASSTELVANTPYRVVVKSVCGEDSESLFTSPVSFRTDCDLFFADFNEGFEDTPTGQIPFCWNRILNFSAGTPILDVTTFSLPQFGSQQIRFNASSDANAELTLVSPELGDLDGTPKRVTFFARQSTATQTNSLQVGTMTDPEDASTFEVVETIDFSGNEMQFFAVNFLDITDENHFAFRPVFSGTFQIVLLDEVTYEEIPACDVPLNVVGDVASSSSADFAWDEVDGAESYDWLIVFAGDDPTEASNILQSGNVEDTEVTVGDLEMNEVYDFYVSAECGAEGVGNLSSPATVSISVCVDGVGPTSTFDTHIEGLELIGEAGTSLLIEDNCPAQTGVQLELDQEVFVIPGASYELSIDHGTCGGFFNRRGKVWVDFNQSLSFDEDEVIGSFQNTATTSTENALLDLEIPSDLDFGVYRMRVVLQETTIEVTNPCNSFTWGNVIDFLITVVDPDDIPSQTANLQVIHNSPDLLASSVDVYVNGALLPELTGVDFRNATAFLEVPANVDLEVDIVPAGGELSESVHNETFVLDANENYIVVANGVLDEDLLTDESFELSVYVGARLEAVNSSQVDVLVHHGSPDAPAVDVAVVGEGLVVTDIAYPEFQGYLSVLSQNVDLEILPTSSTMPLAVYSAPLSAFEGQAITVLASGFLGDDATSSNEFGLWVATATGGALIELTEITASNSEFDNVNFNYYPNPVKSHLTIQAANTVEKVEVYNVLGQRVLMERPNSTNPSIGMGDLVSGVYLMKVSINGEQKSFQVIKE